MKKYVVDRYNDAIAAHAAALWGVGGDGLTDLGGFESFVYEAEIAGTAAILKVGHSDRRSHDLLVAEAEFTRFLADRDISVASAIESADRNLVEPIDDGEGGFFMATAWTKAQGDPIPRLCEDLAFWEAHGELLGAIHAATVDYKPVHGDRPAWDDDVFLEDSFHIPADDTRAIEIRDTLLAEQRALPTPPDAYGLVHHDAHGGNAMWDGSTVTLFDFDDSGYLWFANDLAIVMYYGLLPFDDPVAAAETIWPAFIDGYQRHHRLDKQWFELFPSFLAWRDVLLLSVIHRSRDTITDLDVDAWIERFHLRHATDRPLIDFDFTTAVA